MIKKSVFVLAAMFVVGSSWGTEIKSKESENAKVNMAVDAELLGSWKFDKLTCASGNPINSSIGTYTVNFHFYPTYMFYTGTSTYTGKKCHSFYPPTPYDTAVDGNFRVFQTLVPPGQTAVNVVSHCPSTQQNEDFTFIPDILQYEIDGLNLRIIRSPVVKPNRFCQVGDRVIEHLVRE